MAVITMSGQGSAMQVADLVSQGLRQSALSCTLVESVSRSVGSINMIILVFEKYYMRSSNRASLTVVITETSENTIIDAIGSGGGQGALFSFSWGAEENFVDTLAAIMRRYGFN